MRMPCPFKGARSAARMALSSTLVLCPSERNDTRTRAVGGEGNCDWRVVYAKVIGESPVTLGTTLWLRPSLPSWHGPSGGTSHGRGASPRCLRGAHLLVEFKREVVGLGPTVRSVSMNLPTENFRVLPEPWEESQQKVGTSCQ